VVQRLKDKEPPQESNNKKAKITPTNIFTLSKIEKD
jgi:hypothetical protein